MKNSSRVLAAAVATSITLAISGGGAAIAEEAPESALSISAAEQVACDVQGADSAATTSAEQVTPVEESATTEEAAETPNVANGSTEEASTSPEESTESANDTKELQPEGNKTAEDEAAADTATIEEPTDEAVNEAKGSKDEKEKKDASTDTEALKAQETTNADKAKSDSSDEAGLTASATHKWESWKDTKNPYIVDMTGYPYLEIPTDSSLLSYLDITTRETANPNWLLYYFSKKNPDVEIPDEYWLLHSPYWLVNSSYIMSLEHMPIDSVDPDELELIGVTPQASGPTLYHYMYRGRHYGHNEGDTELFAGQGPTITSGSGSSSQVNHESSRATNSLSYISGTSAALTPATGSGYVSPATPATGDATSFVGAIGAAFSALGAFGAAHILRRRR